MNSGSLAFCPPFCVTVTVSRFFFAPLRYAWKNRFPPKKRAKWINWETCVYNYPVLMHTWSSVRSWYYFNFFYWHGREMLLIENRTKCKPENIFSLCRKRSLSPFNDQIWLTNANRLFWLPTLYILRTIFASVGPCWKIGQKMNHIWRIKNFLGNEFMLAIRQLCFWCQNWPCLNTTEKKQGKIEKMIWNVNFVSSYRPRFAKFDSWSLVNKSTVCSNS